VACAGEASTYLRALAAAPGQVRLDDETLISGCLTGGQSGADLGTAGQAMVEAATELNRQARRDPGGRANVAVGYLAGAVERGALTTGGIHADLQRRLDVAARFQRSSGETSAAFRRAFERGATAGRRSG